MRRTLKIAAALAACAGATWLGIAIYNAKPLKCISYLEDWCIKKVVDR
ncbi:hypothetical protein [Bradyrhizobium canariense]|nr:hypothetical protein [Bradyrhizobium canariense]